jgi:hypothetical protein
MKTSKEIYDFLDKIEKSLKESENYQMEVALSLGKCIGMLRSLAIEIEVTEICLLKDLKAN